MATAAERVKVNILEHLWRGIVGGIIAFLVFNILVHHVSNKFLGQPMDVALAMVVLHLDLTVANIFRFIFGGFVFPIVYLAVFLPFVPLASAQRGLVFGGLLWLFVGLLVTPWAGPGWFFGGMKPALLSLMNHLIYGIILGVVVGPPSLVDQRRSRGF
jgi:hypothetical protein